MLEYKIHIQLGDRLQTFTCLEYLKHDGLITFNDKFGQPKEFSLTALVGIETKEVKE
jgi:hypothetical protein